MRLYKISMVIFVAALTIAIPASAKYKRITLNTKCQICDNCKKGEITVTQSCVTKMQQACRGKSLYYVGINDADKFYTGKNGKRTANITYSCADIDTAKKIKKIYGE